ncbi:hypothetical protein, partial [Candidatus Contendibacter odensensis]
TVFIITLLYSNHKCYDYKKMPPVNFPVIGTVGQAGKMNSTYLDQWVGFSQRPRLTLPTLAITGKFTGPKNERKGR